MSTRRFAVVSAAVLVSATACANGSSTADRELPSPIDTTVVAAQEPPGVETGPPAAPPDTVEVVLDAAGLDDPGPLGVGSTRLTFDSRVADGPLSVLSFYPAVGDGPSAVRDGPPDVSGAPYPVVLGNMNMAAVLGPHLASHGFVFLALDAALETEEVDWPLELAAVLDGIEQLDHPLAPIMDADRAGVAGYSGESLFALMLAGARIDPDHYAETCAEPSSDWGNEFRDLACSTEWWEKISERARLAGIVTPDGLWESLGDDRIKASLPMGPRGFYLIGPEGLASASVPILLVVGGEDTERALEAAAIATAYPSGLAQLLTFEGAGHSMIFDTDVQAEIRRFALAFLTLHLAGDDRYADVLTAEFVSELNASVESSRSFRGLRWGT